MEITKTLRLTTSTCRFCNYYQPEGRRGGSCSQLNVPVQSNWKACSLAISPFASPWESLEAIWRDEELMSKEIVSGNCSLEDSAPRFSTDEPTSSPGETEPKTLLV